MMDRETLNLASLGADILLKATLLLGLAGVGRLLLRRASASLRQIIGVLALGGILMLPLLTPVMPDWKVPVVPAVFIAPEAETEPARGWRSTDEPVVARATAAKATKDSKVKEHGATLARETASVASADFGYGVIREPEVQPIAPPRARWSLPSAAVLASVFLSLWAAVAAALLLRLGAGIVRVFRYGRAAEPATEPKWTELVHELSAKLGLKKAVSVKFTDDVAVAVTAGFFRPILLLPTLARRWSPELRRVVLMHELAHVRRGDWFALLLAETAAAVYWLHPLVWLSVRQLRHDSEQAADDFVLRSGTKASVYAGHLLGIIRSLRHPAPPPIPAMGVARPSQFEARLKAILDPKSPREEASTGQLRMAASFAAGAVLVLGALEPWKSITSEVPTPDESTAKVASGESCDSAKKKNEKPESSPALRADHSGEDDFMTVSASDSDSDSPSEEPEAEFAYGEDDPATPPATGSAVPAIWEGEKEQKEGFVRASRKNPRTGSDWYGRGMELHGDGDYDNAIAAFGKAIELGHRADAASYNIACGYALKGDKDRAFKWLDRAMAEGFDVSDYMGHDDDLDGLKSDPRFAQYRQKSKSIVREARRTQIERKVARLEEATRNDPKNGAPFYKLGYELYEAGEHARAAKAFRQAAELGYREATSLYNTACMLSLDGDKRGALDYLERSVLAGFGSADKLREDDDLDNIRSEPRYRELIQLVEDLELPDLPQRGWHDKWGVRSSRVRRTQEWREAADEIQAMTQKHPRIGRAWFNLGFARLEAGQPEEALRAFEKALELNHRRPTTMYNLACTYSLLDRKEQAFDWLFKAIEAGFHSSGTLRSDDDLDNLRGDPRYRQALKLADKHDRGDHDDDD